MASHRSMALAYPRWGGNARGATRVDRHSLVLVVGFLALVALAGVLYLSQASVAAGMRYRLGDLQKEAQDLWEQNLILEREIADLERLATVEARAARLGMVDAPGTGPYVVCIVPQAEPVAVRAPVLAYGTGGW